MALPRNIIQVESNFEDRHQNIIQFAVKAKLYFLVRSGQNNLNLLQRELENILIQCGQLFGIRPGKVQAFCMYSDIDLEEECRGFNAIRRDYWYGKFRDDRVTLYIFILGNPMPQ